MRLGVLVSGRGSNLEAVLGAVASGRLRAEPAIVIANRGGIRALEVARCHGVPTRVLPRSAFPSGEARDGAIGRALAGAGVELALLAGYDQVLRPTYFAAYFGRTINIHPSLLPAYGGRGMVGLAVHAAVLAAGEHETGATIHEVIPMLDAGPILARRTVPVLAGDDPERLARRVLEIEHELLVETLVALVASADHGTASASMTGAPAPSGRVQRGD